MQISNTLRQECMPDMVYSLCKLVSSKKSNKETICGLLTLGSTAKVSIDQVNKIYNFSKECGFISEEANETVVCNFDKRELESFRRFRYALFKNTLGDLNTKFPDIAKWYLNQDKSIFSITKSEDFMAKIPPKYNISQEYVLGFRFWMVALGMATIYKSGVSMGLVFSVNGILKDWLEFEKPFKKGETILINEFIRKLCDDCPVFSESSANNIINLSLSSGLRVLYMNEILNLVYSKDSGDVWHLASSLTYQETNSITEVIVR